MKRVGGSGGEPEFQKCEKECKFHIKSSGSTIHSTNYPFNYGHTENCKWTLEGTEGTNILLTFSEFSTEKNFDTVQIFGGGRTEETSVNIDTLSGDLPPSQQFVSASNFMIIKFKSDSAVEKKGFQASWTAQSQSCGGDLFATQSPEVILSHNKYPTVAYPGGLECLHTITASNGKIITLEIEDFEMEPDKDFVLIR